MGNIKMKFSIIIPMYNSSANIGSLIEQLKNQTYPEFECFLIDDGSTDSTVSECKNKITDDSRFMLICHKQNKGVSAARNKGLEKASGDYLIFVDSDDNIEENLLSEVLKVADGQIIQYNFFAISEGKIKQWTKSKGAFDIKAGKMGVVWRHAIPRKKITKLRFDETISGGEDYLFLNEALIKISSVYVLSKCLYHHKFDCKTSIMNNVNLNLLNQQIIATEKVKELYKEQISKENNKAFKIRENWCKGEIILYAMNIFDSQEGCIPQLSHLRILWKRIIKKLVAVFS